MNLKLKVHRYIPPLQINSPNGRKKKNFVVIFKLNQKAKMDCNPLDLPLKLMGIIGFHLTYKNNFRGLLLQFLVLYNIIGTIFVLFYSIHEAFQVGGDIDELVVLVSNCTISIEWLVSMTTFYFWRNDFKILVDYLIESLKKGEKFNFVKEFDQKL